MTRKPKFLAALVAAFAALFLAHTGIASANVGHNQCNGPNRLQATTAAGWLQEIAAEQVTTDAANIAAQHGFYNPTDISFKPWVLRRTKVIRLDHSATGMDYYCPGNSHHMLAWQPSTRGPGSPVGMILPGNLMPSDVRDTPASGFVAKSMTFTTLYADDCGNIWIAIVTQTLYVRQKHETKQHVAPKAPCCDVPFTIKVRKVLVVLNAKGKVTGYLSGVKVPLKEYFWRTKNLITTGPKQSIVSGKGYTTVTVHQVGDMLCEKYDSSQMAPFNASAWPVCQKVVKAGQCITFYNKVVTGSTFTFKAIGRKTVVDGDAAVTNQFASENIPINVTWTLNGKQGSFVGHLPANNTSYCLTPNGAKSCFNFPQGTVVTATEAMTPDQATKMTPVGSTSITKVAGSSDFTFYFVNKVLPAPKCTTCLPPSPTPTPTPASYSCTIGWSLQKDGRTVNFNVNPSSYNGPNSSISFGDGSSAPGLQVSHTYSSDGNWTATANITFNDGGKASCSVVVTTQLATLPPPNTNSSGQPTSGGVSGSDPQAGSPGSTVPTGSDGNVLPPP